MTRSCQACGQPVLLAAASRWGGMLLPFDPEPGNAGGRYDTALSADLTFVAASYGDTAVAFRGKAVLYRAHGWSCPQGLAVAS